MLIVADRKGNTDGTASNFLQHVQSEIPIVLMARTHKYRFNENLLSVKRYVLFEFSEMGWDCDLDKSGSHIWGQNTERFPQFADDGYKRFDEWVSNNPPLLTFQRELLKRDESETLVPIDYPCWFQPRAIQSKETFNGRPIDGFYFWGRSHEARLRLHANIWMAASQKGFSVCDNLSFFEKFMFEENSRKWVSLWMPHYGRIDIKEILGRQELSKTSIALPGAGIKTFRHCEASLNSVMVKWKDNLAWAYPWDETNCILTEEGKEIESVEQAVNNPNLYDIYRAGTENCQRYQINNYINNYINPLIAKL